MDTGYFAIGVKINFNTCVGVIMIKKLLTRRPKCIGTILGVVFLTLFFHVSVYGNEEPGEDVYYKDTISSEFFEQHGTTMLIINVNSGRIISANNAAVKFYGYMRSELIGMKISDINVLSQEEVQKNLNTADEKVQNFFLFEHKKADGTTAFVEVYTYPFQTNGEDYLYSIIHDVTSKVIAEERYARSVKTQRLIMVALILALGSILVLLVVDKRHRRSRQAMVRSSEEIYEHLFEHMHEGYALHEVIVDDNGEAIDYRFLKVNHSFERYTGLKAKDITGKRVLEILPEMEHRWIQAYGNVALKSEDIHIDDYSGDLGKYFSVDAYNAGYGRFITVFVDITDTRKKEKEINFLSFHDQLTGLYNRRFMEEQIQALDTAQSLPFSIIMADVNGLKLSNDAFGHNQGDKLLQGAAELFNSVFREMDIVTRVGGDEFVVLLPNTSKHVVLEIMERLNDRIKDITVGPIPLSISFGDATKIDVTEDIQAVYKKAEDRMYHNKLLESHKTRSRMIHYIFRTIELDYGIIDHHQKRVSELAEETAEIFDLLKGEKDNLIDAALYHDVGLVAIDMNLPNKPGALDEDERVEIRRHSECGYRILCAISEYAEIADIILAHHEWYNGAGYPKNLRGDEIPYISRVLAVLDSYDAMTHERLYKKVYSKEGAIEELRAHRGTQFDPAVLDCFIEWLENN